jgi:hypothetical protein
MQWRLRFCQRPLLCAFCHTFALYTRHRTEYGLVRGCRCFPLSTLMSPDPMLIRLLDSPRLSGIFGKPAPVNRAPCEPSQRRRLCALEPCWTPSPLGYVDFPHEKIRTLSHAPLGIIQGILRSARPSSGPRAGTRISRKMSRPPKNNCAHCRVSLGPLLLVRFRRLWAARLIFVAPVPMPAKITAVWLCARVTPLAAFGVHP